MRSSAGRVDAALLLTLDETKSSWESSVRFLTCTAPVNCESEVGVACLQSEHGVQPAGKDGACTTLCKRFQPPLICTTLLWIQEMGRRRESNQCLPIYWQSQQGAGTNLMFETHRDYDLLRVKREWSWNPAWTVRCHVMKVGSRALPSLAVAVHNSKWQYHPEALTLQDPRLGLLHARFADWLPISEDILKSCCTSTAFSAQKEQVSSFASILFFPLWSISLTILEQVFCAHLKKMHDPASMLCLLSLSTASLPLLTQTVWCVLFVQPKWSKQFELLPIAPSLRLRLRNSSSFLCSWWLCEVACARCSTAASMFLFRPDFDHESVASSVKWNLAGEKFPQLSRHQTFHSPTLPVSASRRWIRSQGAYSMLYYCCKAEYQD